jgi:hypothetical protein
MFIGDNVKDQFYYLNYSNVYTINVNKNFYLKIPSGNQLIFLLRVMLIFLWNLSYSFIKSTKLTDNYIKLSNKDIMEV